MANRVLEVFLHGRRAGALRRKDNGNLQFRYDREYIEAGGQPLSLNLPLREEAFPHRDCLAFFGNLLPEEDVRAQLALTTGISASNDYRLLERFGGDVAGAVTLLASDEPPPGAGRDELEPLSPERLDKILVELPQRPLAADEAGEARLSLAGAQSKLPVVEIEGGFALPHGSGLPTTHILKPEPERFPGLVANEFFCMRLAAAAGLEVAEVDRAETASGLPYLIVTRYDRDLTQEPVRRLHQEDLCQALGKPYFEKYQAEGGPGVIDVMALIDDASTAAYGELTQRLAMSIDGAKNLGEVDRAAWQQLGDEIRFAPRFLEQRMEPFVARVREALPELAADLGHAHEIVREIAIGITERAERLMPPRPR